MCLCADFASVANGIRPPPSLSFSLCLYVSEGFKLSQLSELDTIGKDYRSGSFMITGKEKVKKLPLI